MPTDIDYMQLALEEARAAAAAGEVPIGAILVFEEKIIARSGNRTIPDNDPTAHAEIVVIREASHVLNNYRLRRFPLRHPRALRDVCGRHDSGTRHKTHLWCGRSTRRRRQHLL